MTLNYKDNIREGVHRLRKERRWTQVQLAKLLGLSQSRLSEIEQGNGSLTAEHFLTILQTFNISLDYFVKTEVNDSALQNTLNRLGASHLQENQDVLASEKIAQVSYVFREILLSAKSSRQLTSLAPVFVVNARSLDLNHLWRYLYDLGFANRLGWFVENIYIALGQELKQIIPIELARKYRRAEVILREFINAHRPIQQGSPAEDILDENIVSEKTCQLVKKSRSSISQRWQIVTRITTENFAEALRVACETN